MPQRTIKQWCSKHKINWYGQGSLGGIRYDWKLAFGHGRSAFFSSGVSSATPAVQDLNGRPILVFPNVNTSRRNGKISEAAFLRIIDWVQRCLNGEVSDLEQHESPSKALDANACPQGLRIKKE